MPTPGPLGGTEETSRALGAGGTSLFSALRLREARGCRGSELIQPAGPRRPCGPGSPLLGGDGGVGSLGPQASGFEPERGGLNRGGWWPLSRVWRGAQLTHRQVVLSRWLPGCTLWREGRRRSSAKALGWRAGLSLQPLRQWDRTEGRTPDTRSCAPPPGPAPPAQGPFKGKRPAPWITVRALPQ